MNVEDVDKVKDFPDNLLDEIFRQTKETLEEYIKIEWDNGLRWNVDQPPYDLDNKYSQAQLKDFSWRIVEEVAEALECCPLDEDGSFSRLPWERHEVHFYEELADAIHFFVELLVFSGIGPKDFRPIQGITPDREHEPMDFIVPLGLAMNCLKNKPWKSTHMETDKGKYRSQLVVAFNEFIHWLKCVDMDDQRIYDYFFRKNQVNRFRQRSNY